MSGVAFVSKTASEKEKQRKREARQALLEQAKHDYDVKAEKAERRAAKGADTWMSSGFSARLEAEKRLHGPATDSDSDELKKKNKSKKQKKDKHKKKKKKERKNHGSDDDSSQSDKDGGDAWVPAGETTSKPANGKPIGQPTAPSSSASQRDSWMLEPSASGADFFSALGRPKAESEAQRKRREEAEEKKNMLDTPGQHPLELNPHWKDGGTGLPPEEEQARKQAAKTMIGDGGKSWIRRAYQRAVEQAEREGRTLEEVAAERWGSLEKLEALLASVGDGPSYGRGRGSHGGRDRPRYDSRDSYRYRREGDNDRTSGSRGFRRPGDDRDRPSGGFRRPGDDSARSGDFRRPGDDDDRGGPRGFRHPDEGRDAAGSRAFRRPGDGDDVDRSRGSSFARSRDDCDGDSQRRSAPGRRSRSPDGEDRGRRRRSPSPARHSDRDSHSRRRDVASAPGSATAPSRQQQQRSTSRSPPPSDATLRGDVAKTTGSVTPSSSTAESGSGSGRQPEAKAAPPPARAVEPAVTEAQLNTLGAKIVKAEIMGNKELAAKLQQKLSKLQERKKEQEATGASQPPTVGVAAGGRGGAAAATGNRHAPQGRRNPGEGDGAGGDDTEEVHLTRTDRHGNVRPVYGGDEGLSHQGRRQRQKKVATHGDGERERYFADDDKFTLSEMVVREKMSTAEDMDAALHRMSGRFIEKTNDDDYTLDDMYVSRAARKQRDGKEEERDMRKAMGEHRRSAAALDRCNLCMDSPRFSKQLVVAMGMKVYLSVPDHIPLTDGHCVLVPMDHSLSLVAVDEEVVQEIRVFQKGLVAMFKEQDEDIIFLETCYLRKRRHMMIECIPVPKEVGDMAPIYFKKAIMESEEEWSVNKKLVDTRGKGVRKSIPKGFSYFSVDFGMDGGFAHAIEDDETFPWYFGREIIGGILDADPQLWRKPRHLGPSEQKRKVMNFSKMWDPYDWTKRLQA